MIYETHNHILKSWVCLSAWKAEERSCQMKGQAVAQPHTSGTSPSTLSSFPLNLGLTCEFP